MVDEMVERQDVGCLVMQAIHRKGVEVVPRIACFAGLPYAVKRRW